MDKRQDSKNLERLKHLMQSHDKTHKRGVDKRSRFYSEGYSEYKMTTPGRKFELSGDE